MKRGEVWWVRFGPSVGGEIQKQRPAVILSSNASNRFLNRVQVVPLSSKVDRIFSSEARVRIGGKSGKALANQLTTVSKLRLSNRMGRLSAVELQDIERAVRVQLGMAP
jgi:mRNA interferase MazF